MAAETVTATKRAGFENVIGVKKVEIHVVQLKLSEQFGESMGIFDKLFRPLPSRKMTVDELARDEQLFWDLAANEKETQELQQVKAATIGELTDLYEQVDLFLPTINLGYSVYPAIS
jgi:hypothetical protein